jgi:hypothetical protein
LLRTRLGPLDGFYQHSRKLHFAEPERLRREPQIGYIAARVYSHTQLAITGANPDLYLRESLP